MAGTLYLIPTPIGNLGDCTPRMAETLAAADFVAAEDTRVSVKLLNHLGIRKPMMAYYRHNTEAGGAAILARILTGESCALVSDAGTPGISDPGEELVSRCVEAGITVVALAGPCALITALAVSGLPTGRFTFEGFLAINKKNRRAHLDSLRAETRTMVFYEAPHKLTATLSDLCAAFGEDRRVALCRELTKLHEEIVRTTLGEAAERCRVTPPRGEYVVVVSGAAPTPPREADYPAALAEVARLRAQGSPLRDAVKQAAVRCGVSKNQLYDLALAQEQLEEEKVRNPIM